MDFLYPAIEPFAELRIPVSKLHTLHVEQCGNPNGKPVLFIHGGPGGGINAIYRQFFDPNYYHVILVDQRGAGKSTPYAETKENNTQNLINDFEIIRQQLNIEKWMLFGGSWGSTLGLAYAQAHPEQVTEMVLRGIYLASDIENQWAFGGQGANRIFPDYWQNFVNLIPEEERHDMLGAFHRRLNHEDPKIQKQAADAWSGWEISISKLHHDPEAVSAFLASPSGVATATLECHYMYNGCFLDENQLLNNMDKIQHLPGYIVQGRYDTMCAPASAWALHQAWPGSKMHFVAEAGHSMTDPALAKKLVEVTDIIKNNIT